MKQSKPVLGMEQFANCVRFGGMPNINGNWESPELKNLVEQWCLAHTVVEGIIARLERETGMAIRDEVLR